MMTAKDDEEKCPKNYFDCQTMIRGDKLKYIDMATRKRLVVAFATEVI